MSDTTIQTLKTMLANLDDAKKYQSLRDVMQTLPAPDLAAVFEDLPAEKMPVIFRLCPKDLAAEVFAELTPETLWVWMMKLYLWIVIRFVKTFA